MFRTSPIFIVFSVMLLPALAQAELQQLEIGGSIQIYGNYFTDFYENGDTTRIDARALFGRPIGFLSQDDTGAVVSDYRSYSANGAEGNAAVEQRTAIHVNATFTDTVSTWIEFDSIGDWGNSFRSNYVRGADGPGSSDLNLYQAYIDIAELSGLPLRLRLGRQELILGNEWLVGNNFWFNPLTYLSFDGVRLTYSADTFTVDAFSMKLNENGVGFANGDSELYGLYGSYTGVEDFELDLYWLLLRDGADIEDVQGGPAVEFIEGILGVDSYATTAFHTVGIRGAGTRGAFDFEGELAYQFGDAGQVGATFAPFGYGDNNARYDTWAALLSIGYTIETAWEPRIYVCGEYYGGEDNRDRSLLEVLNPFDKPAASLSFNRLFSSREVDWFLDGGSLSNIWILMAGVSATPTEKIEIGLDVMHFDVVDTFRSPVLGRFGNARTPFYTPFPWGGKESDGDLGNEAIVWITYAYSEDLNFEAGWAHFFTGDGLEDGNFIDQNGLGFVGGLGDDDGDYFYAGITITF